MRNTRRRLNAEDVESDSPKLGTYIWGAIPFILLSIRKEPSILDRHNIVQQSKLNLNYNTHHLM